MSPHPAACLPAPLEAAVQRLKLALRSAVERSIESLGLAALAATQASRRDALLEAQVELKRKAAPCVLRFNESFDQQVLRGLGVPVADSRPLAEAAADFDAWDTLSLVDDQELEDQIWAERFGMDVAQDCDWELREFNACVAGLLSGSGGATAGPAADGDRNPLRPEALGHALRKAAEAASERTDTRQLLLAELARSLRGMLRDTYGAILADLRRAGVQPLGMALRGAAARAAASRAPGGAVGSSRSVLGTASGQAAPATATPAMVAAPQPAGAAGGGAPGAHAGATLGQVDPGLMSLIRRIAEMSVIDSGPAGLAANGGIDTRQDRARGIAGAAGPPSPPAPNLIHTHRDALRQVSLSAVDRLVIDVIGALFDQILSDPQVPPQLARQIGRLQLPVLRAALGDSSFFVSRRHPVRRFVDRIASLGAGFEDFEDPAAQRFLAQVTLQVQQVLDGDFERADTYETQLRALDAFMAELAREGADPEGRTAELLARKEDELRLRQLYAQRLQGELQALAGPAFVRDFLARTWSQVLLQAARRDGDGSALTHRLRLAGRALFMSVQPKTSQAARKAFLSELPQLMQDLATGLDLIGWPQAQRHAFFGELMPAHAQALKATSARLLDINLLARQVDQVLQRPLPRAEDLAGAPATAQPLPDELLAGLPPFSAEEARRVGLVDDDAVDGFVPAGVPTSGLDIDLDALAGGAALRAAAPAAKRATAAALPAPAVDAPEPTHGSPLVHQVQIGCSYQMELHGAWQKVRLAHVSAGRSFFVFTHGARHAQTIALTRRMLQRLCEAGRLRAFETTALIERASARARLQLAALGRDRGAAPVS